MDTTTDQATREAAADLIDGAIDVIHERGWCQFALCNEEGNVCLVGAVDEVASSRPSALMFIGVGLAYDTIGALAGTPDVVAFNNHPSTTVEDVLLTMKRASASLRDGAL